MHCIVIDFQINSNHSRYRNNHHQYCNELKKRNGKRYSLG